MGEFFQNFLTFNQNAFLTCVYFFYKNLWLILGLVSIGYIFVAEQFADAKDEVRDERQIL